MAVYKGMLTSPIIFYGYGFRNHWVWLNGYAGSEYSFVAWKDYNCIYWYSFDQADSDQFSEASKATTIVTALSNLNLPVEGDIWETTKRSV